VYEEGAMTLAHRPSGTEACSKTADAPVSQYERLAFV
jgi:hypothetical protein